MTQWLPSILLALNPVCALALIWASVCATNQMCRGTHWPVRLGYILLGAGAFSALIAPVFLNHQPTFSEIFLMSGVACLVYSDRRRRALAVVRRTMRR